MDEEILTGGGVNEVVRLGATVRRPAGPWTPTVHALLVHVRGTGFVGVPAPHGYDEKGREVLDHVPGEVGVLPATDEALAACGRLLRGFHDATATFVSPAGATWYFPPREPREVVCHGDAAPYNTVFRDGLPVAFIDFDTAHPGPRMWDVGYAAYRFVPLAADLRRAAQVRRLRAFADGYGLGDADRAALPAAAIARLRHLVAHMRAEAAAGNAAFAGHLAAGHDAIYERDIAHLATLAGG